MFTAVVFTCYNAKVLKRESENVEPVPNAKKEGESMNKKLDTQPVRQMFEAILTLETVEECYQFFEDLMTIKEIESLAQRLQVADLLRKKETYVNIARIANSSTATVSRVNRVLSYGNDGFELVLSRMEKAVGKQKRKK